MSDLIDRQAAIEAVSQFFDKAYIEDADIHKNDALYELSLVPSAQPEIIRCKDCKHYYFADNRIPQEQRFTCDLDGDRWTADSFCSFAERREE